MTSSYLKYFVLLFSTGFALNSHAQILLSGKVKDTNGEPLIGATVLVKETNHGVATDVEGNYNIKLYPGSYTIVVNFIGYEPHSEKVTLTDHREDLNIFLSESSSLLKDVVIRGKSETTEIIERPYSVAAIDVKPLKIRNLDINQILNTTSGIRIREDGGLGSDFNFSLNGFSGKQIKFFIDGIPMDYFGSSLTLNNIPSNLISTIEVYKGVVPVHLGSDALGGAVNITTNTAIKNYLNVSYSLGSFNTHRASVISRYISDKGFIVNANAIFNYSDNNYDVVAEVVNTETGKVTEDEVERFHDAYQSQTIQLEAGVENKPFADKLLIGVIASGNYKEIQSGYNLTNVVGNAYTTDKAFIPTLKYLKKDLFIKGLSMTLNSTYKNGQSMRVDTSSRKYNWYGEYKVKDLDVRSGEISWDKTLFRFKDNAFMASVNLAYDIGNNQSLSFNNTYSRYRRVGEDPISYNAVPFSEPNILSKHISGLSYNINLLEGNLRTVVFGKFFYLDALTWESANLGDSKELSKVTNTQQEGGYGIATTYFLLPQFQIKASYENTYRLPEPIEMFGNGLLIESSPGLKPEQSQNYNLGVLAKGRINNSEFVVEAAYLYRLPENLIRTVALGQTSSFENLQSAKSNVFEGSIKYKYDDFLRIEVNGTYQDIVNNQRLTASGGENYLYGDRLPNTPFLFGNAMAGILFDNIGKSSKLSINWSSLFVEAFYLKWPSQGNRDYKYDIPRQISHNLSMSYAIQNGKYNVSFNCTNIFDSILYDNFMLQKPGRAFHMKLSYFLQDK